MDLPFKQIKKDGLLIREFSKNVDADELVWHRDRSDRQIRIRGGSGWFLQIENQLPKPLIPGSTHYIKKNTYHRVIKGNSNLVVEIREFSDSINEVTRLPKELYTSIDNEIASSGFWKEPNSQDDVDYYESSSGGVLGTPAAERLSEALHAAMSQSGLDIDILVRSHETDDYKMMTLHPEHPAWPNRWLIDAKWYISKQRPGRSTIDIEMMTSEPEDSIDKSLNSSALVRHISQTIRHELVHYEQLKKQAKNKGLSDADAFDEMLKDPNMVPAGDASDPEWKKKYLSSHIEIDAHAHDAAEELLAVYDQEEIMSILRGSVDLSDKKMPNAILHYYEVLGPDHKSTKKFLSKVYTQINLMK